MFEPVQDCVIDSGATSHMTPHQGWFSNLELLQAPQYMVIGDDTKHEIQHKGNVPMQLTDSKLAGLRNVLHVPTMTRNLLSVGQLVDQGLQFGKQARQTFRGPGRRTKQLLQIVHTDVWTATQPSMYGLEYFVSFIDDYLRFTWVYFLRGKSSPEVLSAFQTFQKMVEKQSGKSVLSLRSDRGGEFLSGAFTTYLSEQGILRQKTCSYSPQQNGVAESKNRHIAEAARAMLNEKNMLRSYWAEAVAVAVYLMNRTPTVAVHSKTPLEVFFGSKPDYSHLKVFGCICYVLLMRGGPTPKLPTEIREQLVAEPVSSDSGSGVTSVTIPTTIVPYVPGVDASDGVHSAQPTDSSPLDGDNVLLQRMLSSSTFVEDIHPLDALSQNETAPSDDIQGEVTSAQAAPRKSERVKRPIQRFMHSGFLATHFAFMSQVSQEQEPNSYKEALQHTHWVSAMETELAALHL
ncbi:hypothetical protein R1sor_000941 [Riccia sorocarpa]|uniref:Integrase catalytic domain-containing protein n=1 Tax=Riccia sorocarpa TaxID=122646 RepID=A0ABD3GX50_9MARC